MKSIKCYLLLGVCTLSLMENSRVILGAEPNPTPPTFAKQPSDQHASLFADATFSALASSDVPVSFQWQFNGLALPNMTNSTLTVTNIQKAFAGAYTVLVSNPTGVVTSQVARLTITPFNSMYEFGYSWTDTRGILPDGSNCAWTDPNQFYKNTACNGPMWPEFLAPELGLNYVPANNFAYCGAIAEQIQQQVITFHAPPKPQLSLYFVWDNGVNVPMDEYLNALTNRIFGPQLTHAEVLVNSNTVNRLYAKGARSMVIHNLNGSLLPGDVQDLGTNTPAAKVFEQTFLPALREAINPFIRTHPDVRITFVDISPKLDEIVAEPALYGFTKSDIGALEDPTLTNKSFTGPGADYVYWNKRHGTTKLHQLITAWTLQAINKDVLEELAIAVGEGVPKIQMNHLRIGRDYTLQQSTDLQTWREAISFTASAGTNSWVQPESRDPTSYFRLKWEP